MARIADVMMGFAGVIARIARVIAEVAGVIARVSRVMERVQAVETRLPAVGKRFQIVRYACRRAGQGLATLGDWDRRRGAGSLRPRSRKAKGAHKARPYVEPPAPTPPKPTKVDCAPPPVKPFIATTALGRIVNFKTDANLAPLSRGRVRARSTATDTGARPTGPAPLSTRL